MSKANDRDPTFMQFMDDGSPKIVCEHCAGWFAVSLPIDVTAYAKMINAFARAHRRCALDAQKAALVQRQDNEGGRCTHQPVTKTNCSRGKSGRSGCSWAPMA